MIKIKDDYEISLMKEAGQINYETFELLSSVIKEGVSTLELDKIANDFIISKGATASFLGYNGYPNSICTSINEEVVHGIPSKRVLRNGDIISIDIGVYYKGYHSDAARTYPVGNVDVKTLNLIKYTKDALYKGIAMAKEGNYIGDISKAIYDYATAHKLGVVRELVGHGVGNLLHEDPEVPNYVLKNKGPMLKTGMVIAIEPMLNLGTHKVFMLDDDWTVITGDKKPSAHFEHTVLIKKDGCEILTEGVIKNE